MDLKKMVDCLLPRFGHRGDVQDHGQLILGARLEHARRTVTVRLTGKAGSVPMIGQILSDMGSVNENQLQMALARQRELVTRYCELEKPAEESLWDLIGSVTGTLDLEQVLTLAMENAAKVTGARASTLFLHDENTGELVFSVPTGPAADKLKAVRLPHGQGIAGWVAAHKTALIVPDVQKDSRFYHAIDETTGFVTRSVLAVPLMHGGELLGVLETINKEKGASFTEEDALLLTVFADQAAIAVVNARVHAALKAQLKEIHHSRELLVEAEKQRALQTLATGLSHDFKNLLNAVIGFSELVSLDVTDEAIKKDVDQISNAGRRALELVDQIQGIGGQHKRENVSVEGNSLVSRVIKHFRRALAENVQIRLTLATGAFRISCDPLLMQSALEKVLINAMEAIGDAPGLIKIDASILTVSTKNADKYPQVAPGQYYQVTVVDDGEGIAEDAQRMVFEPYFTTKKGGMGKGLGLSTARGIIKSHGGAITLASIQGEGTAVQILLPVSVAEVKSLVPNVDRLPRGHEHVLIVDDESFISITLEKMLTFLGYQVSRVDRSQKALDRYHDEKTRPDLVITDWALPDIPGDALAEKLVSKYPGARVILLSAFSKDFDEAALRARGIRESLPKPVDIQILATALRRVLDS
ncbi:MAG: GAF domain-containing protein [Pseudomonadota bacterium]